MSPCSIHSFSPKNTIILLLSFISIVLSSLFSLVKSLHYQNVSGFISVFFIYFPHFYFFYFFHLSAWGISTQFCQEMQIISHLMQFQFIYSFIHSFIHLLALALSYQRCCGTSLDCLFKFGLKFLNPFSLGKSLIPNLQKCKHAYI